MKVFIGADHRGFEYKGELVSWLSSQGHEVVDEGADTFMQDDDYTSYAAAVAKSVRRDPSARGVLLCGSGVGVSIMANRMKGVRCALGFQEEQVRHAVTNDHANVLAVASEFTTLEQVQRLCEVFLSTDYTMDPRYIRRTEALDQSVA
ncbi:MAG: Ribose-5-phosphate isomerase B [Microgenomates bacterium OLB22]|nr:MAG: Ribose-5-phosphate isomerase B [Microgenomates bacterium OLB22]